MVVKVNVGKIAPIVLFISLSLCLSSAVFTLVRCQPIERDIEIDCKWKGEPVSANLKWTEPTENPTKISNADDGSKPKPGTTGSQASTAINTQQALMLTGASAGAALVGGGLLVKKKLESSSSEQETKPKASTNTTASTSSASSTVYTSDSARSYREGLEPHQDELKSSQGSSAQTQSSTPSQTSAQGQRSNTQNPTNDNGPPPTAGQQYMQRQMSSQSSQQQSQPTTQIHQLEQSNVQTSASTLAASTATITKDLLTQKQMDSLTAKSASSTATQAGGTQQSKQVASSTPQNLGLLASSSSSAARIAAEMWSQRQKEFEQLAKQRANLAAKFSIPSYTGTGLSLASSMTNAAENTWRRLQGFGSALGNGLAKAGSAIKPYTKYIVPIVVAVVVVASIFLLPPAAPAVAGAGMTGLGISVSQGAGLVGAGILVGGMGLYAAHNTIMTYPQQPSFEVQHTQYIQQPTSEMKDAKGSGTYGVDPAQEQLDQADITKGTIIEQGVVHQKIVKNAEEWLESKGQVILSKGLSELDPETMKLLSQYGKPDIITDDCIVECKKGTPDESYGNLAKYQAEKYVQLIQYLKKQGVEKTLVYWFDQWPTDTDWEKVIEYLNANGAVLMPEEIFGEG